MVLLIRGTLMVFVQNISVFGYPKLDINILHPIKHFISFDVTSIDFPVSTTLLILVQFTKIRVKIRFF